MRTASGEFDAARRELQALLRMTDGRELARWVERLIASIDAVDQALAGIEALAVSPETVATTAARSRCRTSPRLLATALGIGLTLSIARKVTASLGALERIVRARAQGAIAEEVVLGRRAGEIGTIGRNIEAFLRHSSTSAGAGR